jgi:hypothetical protein
MSREWDSTPVVVSARRGYAGSAAKRTGHKPQTMSELYSRIDEELEQRLHEAEIVSVGFDVPACCSKCSKVSSVPELDVAA